MAKQTFEKGSLAKLIGDKGRKAHEAHKNEEVVIGGGGDCPPFEDGVAKLTKIGFGKYAKGEGLKDQPFFFAQGTVMVPEFVDAPDGSGRKLKLKGRQTKIGPEPLCDTPKFSRKTFDEHYAWILNELKKLLGVKKEVSFGFNEIEGICEALEKAGPYFECRAWKGKATEEYPNPQVRHEWKGKTDYTPSGPVVSDQSGDADTPTVEAGDTSGDAVDYSAETDLDTLVSAANGQDDSAIERFGVIGLAAGLTNQEIEDSPNWETLKEMILAKEKPANEKVSDSKKDWKEFGKLADAGDSDIATQMQEEAEARGIDHNKFKTWLALATELLKEVKEEASAGPKVGGVVFYKPFDKKKKKPAEKAVECEITAVDADTKTVALKALAGKENWKGVPFSELLQTA